VDEESAGGAEPFVFEVCVRGLAWGVLVFGVPFRELFAVGGELVAAEPSTEAVGVAAAIAGSKHAAHNLKGKCGCCTCCCSQALGDGF